MTIPELENLVRVGQAIERPRYAYTASYAGAVAAKSASLKGTQVWKSVDGKTENRACTIALKR
jgi:hypothetical protein